MADFNVRADSVNVEQIMEQIRTRIREKRGVDYTEQQIHELAAVKLEKFLDPKGVRSDLLDRFRKAQPAYEPPELPNYAFEESTLFESHRAPIRWLRKLFAPLLKLLFNPNPLIQALHIQARLNTMQAEREARREAARRALDQLYYELIHNLVVEATRTGIEVKNLKMRLESVSSRLEFNERRARALEGAVVYKTADETPASVPAPAPRSQPQQAPYQPRTQQQPPPYSRPSTPAPAPAQAVASQSAASPSGSSQAPVSAGTPAVPGEGAPGEGPGTRSRRRRRRRGRRGGGPAAGIMGAPGAAAMPGGAQADQASSADELDGPDDGGEESEEMSAVPSEAAEANVREDAPVPETQASEAASRAVESEPRPSALETFPVEAQPPAPSDSGAQPFHASIGSGNPEPAELPVIEPPPQTHDLAEIEVRAAEHHGEHHAAPPVPPTDSTSTTAPATPPAEPAPAAATTPEQAPSTDGGHTSTDRDPQ